MLLLKDKKLINSLKQKKFRKKYDLFVVEGIKMVQELLQSEYEVQRLFATSASWNDEYEEAIQISEKELNSISFLKEPNQVLALVKIPSLIPEIESKDGEVTLFLDDIQDPGNLGTIIRIADWFGISQVICSSNCVDLYNPKVIQASMGSFLRVRTCYVESVEWIKNWKKHNELPVYGAVLDGKNVYGEKLNGGLIIVGNESQGISDQVKLLIDVPLTIPKLGQAESLNVAMATSVLCSVFQQEQLILQK